MAVSTNLIAYNSKHFTKSGTSLVCEMSDLGGFKLQRIWDDAADVGIAIRSNETNNVAIFYLYKEVREPARGEIGDLAALHFKPIQEHVAKYGQKLAELEVILLND